MKALLTPERIADLPTVAAWLRQAESPRRIVAEHYKDSDQATMVDALVEENVVTQLEHLETHPSVSARVRRGELDLYGWVYRIHTGEIVTLDSSQGKFVPLQENLRPATRPPRRILPESRIR
jgi:carbonic anhydrase